MSKEFYKWMESEEERKHWSGNYNNATRDEFIAKRTWDYQQKRIDNLLDKHLNIIDKMLALVKQYKGMKK